MPRFSMAQPFRATGTGAGALYLDHIAQLSVLCLRDRIW